MAAGADYHHIIGELDTSSTFPLGGLYYVTQDAKLSRSGISGTYTIVAEGKIDIGGSNLVNDVSYVDNLKFFSNHVGDDAIKMGSSDNDFTGYFYAPNGEIEIGGQNNDILGGFLSSTVIVSGSELTITFVPLPPDPNADFDEIPEPWLNGQRATLGFDCSGALPKAFEGNIEINWTTEHGARHISKGIVEGIAES